MIDYLKERFDIKADGLYRKDGTRAGFLRKDGYRVINVSKPKKGQMLEHRAVWLMTHGYVPTELDHIDRNKSNNDIANLRECTRSENNLNKELQKNNNVGHAGVYFHRQSQKYRAEIKRNRKTTSLGYFNTMQEAINARKFAETGR
ncbi:MAG: HNH endonuclease signature motif containing protein [Candidatus Nanopelagicus sp.]